MNNYTSTRLLVLGSLIFMTFLGWFLVQMNPNIGFRQFKKDMSQSYRKEIAPLSGKSYALNIREPKMLQAETRFYQYYLMNLRPRTPAGLSEKNKAEWHRLKKQMEINLLKIRQLRSDPSLYNLGGAIKATLAHPTHTTEEKWHRIAQQLQEAPWYYTAAKDNLVYSDSSKSKLAIEKQLLTLNFLRTELLNALARSNLHEPQRQSIVQHSVQAQIAVKDYLAFCRSLLFEHENLQ